MFWAHNQQTSNMKKYLFGVFFLLSLLAPLTASAAIAEVAFLDQTVATTGTINVGSGTNRALLVCAVAGTSDYTGVTYAGVAMTKVNGIQSDTLGAGRIYSLWILKNPTSGSNTISLNGGSGLAVITATAFTGVDQTNPYNTANPATQNFPTATPNPSTTIVTQYSHSILAGCLDANSSTNVGDANTTLLGTNANSMGYSSTNPLTPGSHSLGETWGGTPQTGVFLILELVESGATKGAKAFNFWQFMDF